MMRSRSEALRAVAGPRPVAFIATLLLSLCTVLTGCMDRPRHKQQLSEKEERVYFHGYTPWPDKKVRISVYDIEGETWDTLANTRSGTQRYTDESGHDWYVWAVYADLPRAMKYWKRKGDDIRIRVKARSNSTDLHTFGVGDDACMESALEVSGIEVINRCSDGLQATLILQCGAQGESCCEASGINYTDACDSGLVCDGANTCVRCGREAEPCCNGFDDKCAGDLQCAHDGRSTCQDCGEFGEACCGSGDVCLDDMRCWNEVCDNSPTDLYVKFITSLDGQHANVTIENGGPNTVRGGFNVNLRSDRSADVTVRCTEDLQPGDTCDLTGLSLTNAATESTPSCAAAVIVDVDNEVSEFDESNNELIQTWYHKPSFTWCTPGSHPWVP